MELNFLFQLGVHRRQRHTRSSRCAPMASVRCTVVMLSLIATPLVFQLVWRWESVQYLCLRSRDLSVSPKLQKKKLRGTRQRLGLSLCVCVCVLGIYTVQGTCGAASSASAANAFALMTKSAKFLRLTVVVLFIAASVLAHSSSTS